MLQLLEGFRFRRRDSVIHRLDPRVKGLYAVVVLTVAMLYSELAVMLLILVVQLPLVLLAGIRREWVRSLRGAAFFAAFILVMNLVSGYFYSGMGLTAATVTFALSMTLRFLTLMMAFSLFFLTTAPDDLAMALEKLRVPHDFTFAFTSAIRFVPELAREVSSIMDAQKSRGLELEGGSFMTRIRNYIPILVPMFVRSFERSLELAEAMEARAYGASETRTSLYELKLKPSDLAALILILAALSISIYARYFLQLPQTSLSFAG
ncbi:MAG: energy-coupling factor transporter transmembrane component T [Candidatus Bathyarchaeia archaeon]